MNNRNDDVFDGELTGVGRRDANNTYTRMDDLAATVDEEAAGVTPQVFN
jgi:hypothetical protein